MFSRDQLKRAASLTEEDFVRLLGRFPQQQPFELFEELVCFSAAQLGLDAELEIPPETVWELMKLCEQHSRPFALDISPLNRTDRIPESNILLVVSESIEEAMSITKTESPSYAIEELHRLGCQNVILINNSTEVTFSDQRRTETISVPIACIVDRCGATECLETWTALSLIRGASLAEACREAVIAMSYSLSYLGGHQGMPRRSEIVEPA